MTARSPANRESWSTWVSGRGEVVYKLEGEDMGEGGVVSYPWYLAAGGRIGSFNGM